MRLVYRLLLFSVTLLAILVAVILAILDTRIQRRIVADRAAGLVREAELIADQWVAGSDPVAMARAASVSLDGRVTLIDMESIIVADAAPVGKNVNPPGTRAVRPEVGKAIASGVGISLDSKGGVSGQELHVAVRAPAGIVRIGVPIESLSQIFETARRDVVYAGAVALALTFLFASLFARYVSQPVMQLRNMAQALARREFDDQPEVSAPGEVGDLAESLGQLRERLQTLERLRSDFIANVSHELCSPLTIASGFAATLAKQDPPPEMRRQFARAILSNTDRMQRVIDDMLDLSRIESGGWLPRSEIVFLSKIAREIFDSLRPAAEQKGLTLVSDFGQGATIFEADRTAVRQTLSNLTENAMRHTSSGEIVVFSERTAEGVWIGVRDTGEGISAEHLHRIFERLYRVDSGRARGIGGTGLGLAIVKHMAEAHGGRVSAESEPGLGTVVKALFPQPMGARRPPTPSGGTRRVTENLAAPA